MAYIYVHVPQKEGELNMSELEKYILFLLPSVSVIIGEYLYKFGKYVYNYVSQKKVNQK